MREHKPQVHAFPVAEIDPVRGCRIHEGMSLLDWFAGQALAGMLADTDVNASWPVIAKAAYEAANAMMDERAKQ